MRGLLAASVLILSAAGRVWAVPETPDAKEVAVAPVAAPEEPSVSLPEEPSVSLTFEERLLQPVSADFQEVDFASAIDFLSESGGVNIVLSQKAKELGRPVSVHLVEMPLQRALEYLLKGQGLNFRRDGQTIWVATRDEMEAEPLETRVYFLTQGPGLFAAFEPLAETRESVALQATSVRELKTVKDILEEVIPQVGESSLMLDERSGALIVTHVPYYLEQVDRLLTQLDIAPLQVIVETRFVEVTFTDTKEWGFDVQLNSDVALTKKDDRDGQTQGPELQISKTGTTLQRGTKTSFTDFTNQTSGNGLNLTLQGILTGAQYSAILHALAENEKTKTLSAPRVTTLNNQTATIKIVTEFVYATRYEASVVREDLNGDGDFLDVVSGTRETRFVNVPQDFVTKDLGILLHVTPSIGRDLKTITLAMKPEVSEKKTDDSFGGEVTLPRFTARNLETTVVISNGETVMLGGLMKDTTSTTRTQVPILGSLPWVGPLFRKDSDSVERSNLLIFVTAQLVNPSGSRLALSELTASAPIGATVKP
jgi:type II secretory pathway component GspD/PulD (secretin)